MRPIAFLFTAVTLAAWLHCTLATADADAAALLSLLRERGGQVSLVSKLNFVWTSHPGGTGVIIFSMPDLCRLT